MIVRVTLDHIRIGVRGSTHTCPIALAVADALGIKDGQERKAQITVDPLTGIEVQLATVGGDRYYRKPWQGFRRWIDRFDDPAVNPPRPWSFDLEIDAEPEHDRGDWR